MMRRGLAFGAAFAVLCLVGVSFGIELPGAPAQAATATTERSPDGVLAREVQAGDTLDGILRALGLDKVAADRIGKALKGAFDTRELKPGHKVRVFVASGSDGKRSPTGALLELDKGRRIEVALDRQGLFVAKTGAARAVASARNAPLPKPIPRPVLAMPEAPAEPSQPVVPAEPAVAAAAVSAVSAEPAVPAEPAEPVPSVVPSAPSAPSVAARADVPVPRPRPANLVPTAEITVAAAPKLRAVPLPPRRPEGVGGERASELAAAVQAPSPEQARGPVVEAVAAKLADLAEPEPAPAPQPMQQERVVLAKGGTLHSLLKARGYLGGEVVTAARALALSVDPSTLRWGQEIQIAYAQDGDGVKRLQRLTLVPPGGAPVVIGRQVDGSYAALGERGQAPSNEGVAALARVGSAAQAEAVAAEETDEPQSPTIGEFIEEQAAPRDAAYRLAVEPGDSLMAMLRREGVDATEIDQAVRALRKQYNPRRLREGETIAVLIDSNAAGDIHLAGFSVPVGEKGVVEVLRREDGSFSASRRRSPSFAERLPPEGVIAVAGGDARGALGLRAFAENALASVRSRGAASEGATEGEEGDDTGGWSVMSWLGSIGDALGRTGEAEAAIMDFEPEPRRNRSLDLEEPTAPPAEEAPASAALDLDREVELVRGDTIMTALARGGVGADDARAAVQALKEVHSPRRLQAGQRLALLFAAFDYPGGLPAGGSADAPLALRRISFSASPDHEIVVERTSADSFRAREIERPLVRSVYKAAGAISSSFYDSALAAGLSMDILMQMTRMFSYDVDFQRSLRDGDTFEVLYERTENDEGVAVEQSTVLFAALNVGGERLELFRFEPLDGAPDYYDRTGQSVRKALLRTPIDGARISSGFGARKHPILGFTKRHKGVDFSAPSGTPVFAGGDGVIEKIGWFSSYGKYIRIRHSDTLKTAYAHLRGYARGMKVGTRVRQGQVIGYVGSTGRSTGPHLHHEVLRNEVQINPNDSKLPIGKQLAGKQLARFAAEIRSYAAMYAQAETRTRVAQRDGSGRGR
jgi:murein DD-endopeptidase MepM/ murein hydrolase activator NlpD